MRQPAPEWTLEMGARVEALRTERGLTQKELAERVHCDPNYLSKILRAERRPSPQLRRELADALGTTMTYFHTGQGAAKRTVEYDETDPYPNRRALKLSSHWKDASPEARAYVASIRNLKGDYLLNEWIHELESAQRRVDRGESLLTTAGAEEDLVDDPDEDR